MPKQGFTLIEIIVTIVIMGVLVTLAVPRFTSQQERAVFSEGISALQMMFAAQQRYFMDHASFEADATCYFLDVEPRARNFSIACADPGAAGGVIATAQRNSPPGPNYTITVDNNGAYQCASCTGSLSYLERGLPR
ncbi:MAG: prepilin-type N-terminal cleavage/methylation domain-containing protein [Candidatus Omnitrophica bacterium]|nr:prepilin-type N-terminal cleavage/methylation domain-containing protein [Candidatus Omnitrophota bacterium]